MSWSKLQLLKIGYWDCSVLICAWSWAMIACKLCVSWSETVLVVSANAKTGRARSATPRITDIFLDITIIIVAQSVCAAICEL